MTPDQRTEWEQDEEALRRGTAEGHVPGPESTLPAPQGSRALPDLARVAAYAEAIIDAALAQVDSRTPWAQSAALVYARAVVAVADGELAAKDAEIARLKSDLAAAVCAQVEAVEALLDRDDAFLWVGEPDGWMVSAKRLRAALADAPTEQGEPPVGFKTQEEYDRVSRDLRAAAALPTGAPPWSESESYGPPAEVTPPAEQWSSCYAHGWPAGTPCPECSARHRAERQALGIPLPDATAEGSDHASE